MRRSSLFSRKSLLLIILGILWFIEGRAQVHIAPVALYLDEGTQTGRVVVRNSSSQPVELNTELHFGYPATNSEGLVYLKILKTVPATEPSAMDWVRVYPRHLILPPNEQQTIRFAARPPRDLPAGEYWARPAVVARPVSTAPSRVSNEITTQINTVKRTFLSANYRHGTVKTGVAVHRIKTYFEGSVLKLEADLERKGNAAYLGHIDIRLTDDAGFLHKKLHKEIAVYHKLNPIYKFDVSDVPPGTYSLQLNLYTEDRANGSGSILSAPRVTEIQTVTIDL